MVHQHDHTLKMPLFSLDELLEMRKSVDLYRDNVSEESARFLYKLAGGNAKMVLGQPTFHGFKPSDVEDFLRSKVIGLAESQLQVTSCLCRCYCTSHDHHVWLE